MKSSMAIETADKKDTFCWSNCFTKAPEKKVTYNSFEAKLFLKAVGGRKVVLSLIWQFIS